MDPSAPAEMNAVERDEFLETENYGVMSFATEAAGEAPHAIPVSYDYDAGDHTFYFRLAVGPDRAKGDPTGRAVSFVVYGHTDDGWRSVRVSGTLESTTEDAIATETLAGLEGVHIPLVDIFGERPADVQFDVFRLVPEEFTTRKEASTAF